MIRHLLFSLVAACGLAPMAAFAQPANDDCAGAIVLTPGGTCTPVAGDVAGATPSIPGTVLCDGFNATPDDDVWYRFTATSVAHLIQVQGSANFDAVIQLLGGACNGTAIDCQDVVSAGGLEVLAAGGLTIGTEYLVRVFTYGATVPATTTFTICVTAGVTPVNDDCANAIELIPNPTCNPVAGTTENATASITGLVTCTGFLANPNDDVWYRFVATSTDHLVNVTPSAGFDPVVQLRDGTAGCNGAPIICYADGGTGVAVNLNFTGLTVGNTYYLRVFHYAAATPTTPTFTICLQGPAPATCDADASTLSPNRPEVCFEDGPTLIDAAFDALPTVPTGYEVLHVLTTGPGLTIVQTSATPAFFVDALGDYVIHSLVYDPNTLDLSGVVLGVTQAGEILSQLIQGGGTICGSLDVAGAPVAVIECFECEADAGTITADDESVCLDAGEATISATPDGNAVVPSGYSVVYVLTTGGDLVILDAGADPTFTVNAAGDYTIHTLVYDPATLDLGIVEFGVTTGGDVLQFILDNEICASLDAAGAPITVEDCVCLANAGTITADDESVCLDAGEAIISATADGNSVVPSGYSVVYVLTTGGDLVILDAGADPSFTVNAAGDYTIHTLVYDPSTLDLGIVEFGVTTGGDVLQYITDNSICASLDAVGAPITVEDCACLASAGTITADQDTYCLDAGGSVIIVATPNGDAVVPIGYETLYVLTQGAGLVILEADVAPFFQVEEVGDYTIHTLVYDPNTLDLGIVEFGVTTGFDVLQYITDNSICASLDATGAPITVENCIVCDATAGELAIDASPVCLMMGEAQVSATFTVAPTVPDGFEVGYVLTEGAGLVIVGLNGSPVFSVAQPGNYTIHTVVYDPLTVDLSLIELGVTTGFDVNALLIQGGGTICGALDVVGAPVVVNDCSPANDDCISSAPLAINAVDDCPANATAGDNTYADMDGAVPSCDAGGSYLFDVWYTFNADQNTEVTLNFDPGTMEDWVIAIFDACGGNELGCYINPADPIVIATAAFTDYVVQVYSNFTNGNGGQFNICLTGATPTVVCDGGQVQTSDGFFSVDVCQDTEADVVDFITSSTSGEQYAFVLTDDNDVIVALLVGGSLDFNSAPLGLYRVWGVSYNGDLVGAEPGLLATDVTSTGTCLALSANYVLVNVDICDGVADVEATAWNLYPSPGTGEFSLVGPADGAAQVSVVDLSGRVVHTEQVTMAKGQPSAFNLSGQLAPGAYAVRVNGAGQAVTLRMVVR